MWEKLKNFMAEMESVDFTNLSENEKTRIKERLLTEISFFQHERLVHLIVTVTFAILAMLGFVLNAIYPSIAITILELLFLVLLAPYILHYYRLENGVQKLYTYYDKLS